MAGLAGLVLSEVSVDTPPGPGPRQGVLSAGSRVGSGGGSCGARPTVQHPRVRSGAVCGASVDGRGCGKNVWMELPSRPLSSTQMARENSDSSLVC